MRVMVSVCLAAGLWLWSPAAWADIYRRVGPDGVVHYTNVPPGSTGWQRVYRESDADSGSGSGSGSTNAHRWAPPRVERKPDPDRMRRFDTHIREAADLYQLPEHFIRAVMLVESNFYPDVVSVDGAQGLMQLMPATAAHMGVTDPFDPRQNVLGGARFLRVLANRFNGDLTLTIAAYNAGEAAVNRYGGVPPYAETRRYVRRVLHHYYNFRNINSELAAR